MSLPRGVIAELLDKRIQWRLRVRHVRSDRTDDVGQYEFGLATDASCAKTGPGMAAATPSTQKGVRIGMANHADRAWVTSTPYHRR